MKFKYSVARYVPSIVRDEAINVGLLLEAESPPALYVRFLGPLSRVRSLFPDADLATLRLLKTYFGSMQFEESSPEQLFMFSTPGAPNLESLVAACRDSSLQLSWPRVTVGSNAAHELAELYERFVSSPGAAAVKPTSAVQLAPYALRERVDRWMRRTGLVGEGRYQRQFELAGTVFPWTFDFGLKNGKVTLVQTLALKAPIEVAMNRALLLSARIDDVAAAQQASPQVVVIADGVDKGSAPARYLEDHDLEPIPADDPRRIEKTLTGKLAN